MRKHNLFILHTVLITLVVTTASANYTIQQPSTTPTSAPSKTPTTWVPEDTPTNQQLIQSNTPEPLNQEDLEILTGNIQRPNGLFWFDDKLYTSCTGDWTIYEINIQTGTTVQYIFGVRNAHTMYIESNNEQTNIWIPDFQTNALTRIDRNGLQNIATNLDGPWGIAPANDSLLVTNMLGNNLIGINRQGETREILTNLRSPTGIVTDTEFVYVANTGSARRAIEWFEAGTILNAEQSLNATDPSISHSLVSGLQSTTNITLGPDGYLYFAYSLGTRGVVGRINPDICRENGGCTHDQIEIVIYTELPAPLAGLTISPDMRLYIHSMFSPEIYWVQLNATGTGTQE